MRFNITLEGIPGTIANLDLADRHIERGVVNGLNKLARRGVTRVVRAITGEYTARAADIKKDVRVIRAAVASRGRKGRIFSTIAASGAAFPLARFRHTPAMPQSQRGIPRAGKGARAAGRPYPGRRRVRVRVLRKGGMETLEHAFLIARGGWAGIFERTGPRSYPIRELQAPGPATMFERTGPPVLREIMRTMGEEVIMHEVAFQLARARLRRTA